MAIRNSHMEDSPMAQESKNGVGPVQLVFKRGSRSHSVVGALSKYTTRTDLSSLLTRD
jgi:hypothetical protein